MWNIVKDNKQMESICTYRAKLSSEAFGKKEGIHKHVHIKVRTSNVKHHEISMITPKMTCGFPAFVASFLLATHVMADEPTPNPAADKAAFETAVAGAEWAEAFSDSCTKDWKAKWFLDGEVGSVTLM